MKKKYMWIATALSLIVVIAVASVLYNKYATRYGGGNLVPIGSEVTGSSESSAPLSGEYSESMENKESGDSNVNVASSDSNVGNSQSASADKEEQSSAVGNAESQSSTEEKAQSSTEEKAQSSSSEEEKSEYAAPDFTVTDIKGNKVRLSDFRGKPVVLNFWATWCRYCKKEMPDFDEAAKKYTDVQFLMVNATDGYQETLASAKAYIAEEGYTFDVFFDTEQEAVNAYHVSSLPVTYFIDKNGDLVTYRRGMLDRATLEKGIEMIR